MRVLVVHCHPESRSFNALLTQEAGHAAGALGHDFEVSDLYGEKFDPVEQARHYPDRFDPSYFSPLAEQRHASGNDALPDDVEREIARLERADLVVLQFPLWWHGPPAMLKGWLDRVFVNGRLYSSKRRYDRGHFLGRRAVCSVTTGAPAAAFGPMGRGGDIEKLLWPVHFSLYYMGFAVLPPFLAFGVQAPGYVYREPQMYEEQLRGYKKQWRQRVSEFEQTPPLSFPGWDDWDGDGRYLQ